jgi:hypothetical protein
MADILVRGVSPSTVELLKTRAAERELTPGELLTRLVDLLELLEELARSEGDHQALARAGLERPS